VINNYYKCFDLSPGLVNDNVERIDINQISQDQFVEKYEKLYKPVVIKGATDNWKAKYKWTLTVSGHCTALAFTSSHNDATFSNSRG